MGSQKFSLGGTKSWSLTCELHLTTDPWLTPEYNEWLPCNGAGPTQRPLWATPTPSDDYWGTQSHPESIPYYRKGDSLPNHYQGLQTNGPSPMVEECHNAQPLHHLAYPRGHNYACETRARLDLRAWACHRYHYHLTVSPQMRILTYCSLQNGALDGTWSIHRNCNNVRRNLAQINTGMSV